MRALLLLCLLLSGCGYRFANAPYTISVPYVEGDAKGQFTQILVNKLAKESPFYYSNCGDLALHVCLMAPVIENVGFRYAPPDDADDEATHILTSTEARLELTAIVRLVDTRNGTLIYGPKSVTSSLSYDFESDFSNVNFHAFALGQLEMNNLAEEVALCPTYGLLAQKIVDVLVADW